MKKADNPVVIINGNNNSVEVKVNVTDTSSKKTAAIIIALCAIIAASILAVSQCCPELLADFVRWIISIAIGG